MKRILSVVLATVLATSVALSGCSSGGRTSASQQPASPPFTTKYDVSEQNVDFFVDNDTAETAMCGGPFYTGSRMLPSQNTAQYDTARAARVAKIKSDAAELVKACDAAKPAMAAARADYVNYCDALKKADPTTAKFAAATLTPLVASTAREAILQAQYAGLANRSQDASERAFTRAFTDYLSVTQAAALGAEYLKDLNQIAGFAAIALRQQAKNAKAGGADSALDSAMGTDFEPAAKALEPVAAKLAAIDDGLKRLSSADHYFAREAVGFMNSEIASLSPTVDSLKPRDGLTAANIADIKTTYDGYKWWTGELTRLVDSQNTSDLVQPVNPVVGLNPFHIDAANAAEGYTPGANYGKAIAVVSEEPKPPSGGYLSTAWSGVKSVFGGLKTGAGVVIDSAGAAVQGVTAVGAGLYYGNSPSEVYGHIKSAVTEVSDNYTKGVSGSKTIKTAGEYLEGVETGAGEMAGKATGATLTWVSDKLGTSEGTQKTIASWSSWATNGITKTSVGMFTGLAKGLYKVGNTQSSTADVVSGFVDIGLSAIGGSKVIVKASQIPGMTKGAYAGLKNLGQAMLNLAKSAANESERAELTAALRATLASKGLTPAQVESLISNSIKVEVAEETARALAASRGQILKNMRDLIASGGSEWWKGLKETVASSWSDLVKKGFSSSMKGALDAGTTVMGGTVTDFIDNLVAGGITDSVLSDLINQALAVAPDPEQVDGNYSGSMLVQKVDIPQGSEKEAQQGNCLAIFKQLEGKHLPLKLKVDATGGKVTMVGSNGSGTGSCSYSAGSITMHVSQQGSTITFNGTAKLRKEGGVGMSGTWTLPYKGSPITMSGTWTATKD